MYSMYKHMHVPSISSRETSIGNFERVLFAINSFSTAEGTSDLYTSVYVCVCVHAGVCACVRVCACVCVPPTWIFGGEDGVVSIPMY